MTMADEYLTADVIMHAPVVRHFLTEANPFTGSYLKIRTEA